MVLLEYLWLFLQPGHKHKTIISFKAIDQQFWLNLYVFQVHSGWMPPGAMKGGCFENCSIKPKQLLTIITLQNHLQWRDVKYNQVEKAVGITQPVLPLLSVQRLHKLQHRRDPLSIKHQGTFS